MKQIIMFLMLIGVVLAQSNFPDDTENPPAIIGYFQVKMTYLAVVGRDPSGNFIPDSVVITSQEIEYFLARMDSNDVEVGNKLGGDLVPHTTAPQRTGLTGFMDSMHGKATGELIQ